MSRCLSDIFLTEVGFVGFDGSCNENNPGDTVDGRNPAPVEVGSLSHYLQSTSFFYISGGAGFLPSAVFVRLLPQ